MAANKRNLLGATLQKYANGIGNESENKTTDENNNKNIEVKNEVKETIEVNKDDTTIIKKDEVAVASEVNPAAETPKTEVVVHTKSEPKVQEKKVKKIQPQSEVEEDQEESIEDIVKDYIRRIEQAKADEKKVNISFVPGTKVKFDDKYPIFSSPARKEIHEVIDILCKNSPMKKYEIFELLVYYGLNSIFNNTK